MILSFFVKFYANLLNGWYEECFVLIIVFSDRERTSQRKAIEPCRCQVRVFFFNEVPCIRYLFMHQQFLHFVFIPLSVLKVFRYKIYCPFKPSCFDLPFQLIRHPYSLDCLCFPQLPWVISVILAGPSYHSQHQLSDLGCLVDPQPT